jgi:YgiT-type zinc finger domain-containing protein
MSNQEQPCEFCDSIEGLEERSVTVYRHGNGQHFIFEQVPARVCRACGHRYFAWDVAEEMDRLMAAPDTLTHTQPIPVIALSPR